MKRSSINKLILSLVLAIGLLGATNLVMSQTTPPPAEPPPAAPAPGSIPKHERHPEIHAAIHALERAKEHLKEAAHDFGGHREKAIHAIDGALFELRAALEFDK